MITYILLIIIILGIFRKLCINTILGLITSIIIIYFLETRKKNQQLNQQKNQQIKYKTIRPPSRLIKYHDDIINFLYDNRIFYAFNPQAFEEMVDNIDQFLLIYNTDPITAEEKKLKSLDALSSISLSIPIEYTSKLNEAKIQLSTILNINHTVKPVNYFII